MTREKIYSIKNQINENLVEIIDKLNLEYKISDNKIMMPCPIHSGDNPEGCCIFLTGVKQKGNWCCWTHGCERVHGSDFLGFIRGLHNLNFHECLEYAMKLIDVNIDDIPNVSIPYTVHKMNEITECLLRNREVEYIPAKREDIIKNLDVPSKYFLNRGFKESTLKTFDVGDCHSEGKPMYNRAVVPVYDEHNRYIGCIGRDITGKSERKWLNSKGFKRKVLYGYNINQDRIKETKTIILVEGQGDVWKLYENGIRNAVGIFGTSISEDQLFLMETIHLENVVILTDMDEPGREAANFIVNKCGRRFNYLLPIISSHDIGDMTEEQIEKELKPQIKGLF